jgi:hypothetical protein
VTDTMASAKQEAEAIILFALLRLAKMRI